MLANIAEHFTRRLINAGAITEQESAIYSYGIEIGLAMIFNVLTTIIIGCVLGLPVESILFLTAFILLRSYAGGFHASSHFRCYWLSVFALVLVLLAVKLGMVNGLMAVIGFGIIVILAPVQDMNKPLDEIEKKVYGIRARAVVCIELVVAAALRVLGFRAVSDTVICVIFLVGVSALVGFLKNKQRLSSTA